MQIACIGWGSLIWKPEKLLIGEQWYADGPELPVEFHRQSKDGSLTLVIAPASSPRVTLWTVMATDDLETAKASLREREGCPMSAIGVICRGQLPGDDPVKQVILEWMEGKELDAVIWTGLGPKFAGEVGRVPTLTEAVAYLHALEGVAQEKAEKYIRSAPKQISTLYRMVFEQEFGWAPLK